MKETDTTIDLAEEVRNASVVVPRMMITVRWTRDDSPGCSLLIAAIDDHPKRHSGSGDDHHVLLLRYRPPESDCVLDLCIPLRGCKFRSFIPYAEWVLTDVLGLSCRDQQRRRDYRPSIDHRCAEHLRQPIGCSGWITTNMGFRPRQRTTV